MFTVADATVAADVAAKVEVGEAVADVHAAVEASRAVVKKDKPAAFADLG